MKVLVIEDEKMVAESIRTILESKGFEVETVYDGEAGTEYAELGIYDLLILDVMMPKLNGFQVARQVRADRCSTPILMLTARSDIEDRIQGLNAGADYYLTKPFDFRELLACVNALLRRVRDFAMVKGEGHIDLAITRMALTALNIDARGLDQMDNRILQTIIGKFNGGPVGLNTIATAVGEDAGTIEEVYEPFLIKEGFLKRTPRGREATPLAYQHLGFTHPRDGEASLF